MTSAKDRTVQLRARVTSAAESALRSGHPWLYAESIREQNRQGQLGDLAVIYDRHDRFLAVGLFDPHSPLRVRILHAGRPTRIDTNWWKGRCQSARVIRQNLFGEDTTGFRWIHGENDGWPGLVLDRYGATAVVKLYTAAWLPRWQEISPVLREYFRPERVVLRLSRNIQAIAQSEFARGDGQVDYGPPLAEPVRFQESGLWFEADVRRGQKTGFFFDQRENRRRVEALASGRRVLNTFSYSGAFSVYAARGGAVEVVDLDISAQALEAAVNNLKLNTAAIQNCRREGIQADAFEWLRQAPFRKFDLIILDPPSLAKRESERNGALGAYRRLAQEALRWLAPDGVLVAASCSAHVSAPEFFETIRNVFRTAGRKSVELETTQHPPDHPANFSEAAYLKCVYFQVAGRG